MKNKEQVPKPFDADCNDDIRDGFGPYDSFNNDAQSDIGMWKQSESDGDLTVDHYIVPNGSGYRTITPPEKD